MSCTVREGLWATLFALSRHLTLADVVVKHVRAYYTRVSCKVKQTQLPSTWWFLHVTDEKKMKTEDSLSWRAESCDVMVDCSLFWQISYTFILLFSGIKWLFKMVLKARETCQPDVFAVRNKVYGEVSDLTEKKELLRKKWIMDMDFPRAESFCFSASDKCCCWFSGVQTDITPHVSSSTVKRIDSHIWQHMREENVIFTVYIIMFVHNYFYDWHFLTKQCVSYTRH